jgi:cell division protein FtsL
LYSRISSLVQDAKTFCDDVASEMRGMFDEKSERWRRDRRVDQEFENLDLEELSEPDESGVDALEAIDDRRPSKVTP